MNVIVDKFFHSNFFSAKLKRKKTAFPQFPSNSLKFPEKVVKFTESIYRVRVKYLSGLYLINILKINSI
jgi:hypothetical protein